MSTRALLIAFAVSGGCGEIREVPVEPAEGDTSGPGQIGTDESTTLAATDGADESGTTEDAPDIDDGTTTAGTDTGAAPDVLWASFCSDAKTAESPGEEIVIEVPVDEVELRSDFRIGMRVRGAQAGLRASVTFDGQEVVLVDEDECTHEVSASFTDAGTLETSLACVSGIRDEDPTLIPLEPLAPLIDGEIAGSWQLRFRSQSTSETPLVVEQTCVFVATPA